MLCWLCSSGGRMAGPIHPPGPEPGPGRTAAQRRLRSKKIRALPPPHRIAHFKTNSIILHHAIGPPLPHICQNACISAVCLEAGIYHIRHRLNGYLD